MGRSVEASKVAVSAGQESVRLARASQPGRTGSAKANLPAPSSAGAGFVVVKTGSIMTMPGLAAKPAALAMTIDEDGVIAGLM